MEKLRSESPDEQAPKWIVGVCQPCCLLWRVRLAYASDAIPPIYCFTTPMIPIYKGGGTGTGANISIHVRAFLCMEGGKAGRGCVPRRSPVCEVETTTVGGLVFCARLGPAPYSICITYKPGYYARLCAATLLSGRHLFYIK